MSKIVEGVGPEAPTETLANGAKQSATPARLDLMPMLALLHVGGILQEGTKKYSEGNWLGIPVKSHLNKALIHIAAFLAGDTQDDHLGHACCRLQMALERKILDDRGAQGPVEGPKDVLREKLKALIERYKEDLEYLADAHKRAKTDGGDVSYWQGRELSVEATLEHLEGMVES